MFRFELRIKLAASRCQVLSAFYRCRMEAKISSYLTLSIPFFIAALFFAILPAKDNAKLGSNRTLNQNELDSYLIFKIEILGLIGLTTRQKWPISLKNESQIIAKSAMRSLPQK